MSLSTFKPATFPISPVAGANDSRDKVSKVTMMIRQAHPPPLQVKGKEKSAVLQESLSSTSRREMLHLTAASVGLLSLLLPASAEAGTRNATMRQKIMEKFEELRRKAGLSKPKDNGEGKKAKDEMEGKSKVESGTKEAVPKSKDGSQDKVKVENGAEKTKAETKDEKKQADTSQESKVAPVIPALPGIMNGKFVETTLP